MQNFGQLQMKMSNFATTGCLQMSARVFRGTSKLFQAPQTVHGVHAPVHWANLQRGTKI